MDDVIYDAIIVGGGPAGLSGALYLGRACRQVAVFDSGQPRNAVSDAIHGFLSRDGIDPAEFGQISREQLVVYPNITFHNKTIIEAQAIAEGFAVTLADGSQQFSRKLLLASGVKDILPAIEGFSQLWGRGVYHCPYCHGWEVRNQPLAVHGNGEDGFRRAKLLTAWSREIALCTDGAFSLGASERQQLTAAGITIYEQKVVRLSEQPAGLEILFADGTKLIRQGIFARPVQQQHSELAEQLGCKFDQNGLVQTDEMGRTNIPGLYVAGDAAKLAQNVLLATVGGALAAVQINVDLIEEAFSKFAPQVEEAASKA